MQLLAGSYTGVFEWTACAVNGQTFICLGR
jgi:hypothetical protein